MNQESYQDSENALEASMNKIFSLQTKYYCELKEHLVSKGFTYIIYTDVVSVMQILEQSIRFFSELFENWCKDNLKSSKDIGTIIFVYSLYERDKNDGRINFTELDIIALYTCRYILAIAPSLYLSAKEDNILKTNDIWLPELFALTNCLGVLSQFRSVEGLSGLESVKIDLTDTCVKFAYLSSDLDTLLQKSKTRGESILAPRFIDYSISIEFQNLLIDVFGDSAECLLEAIILPESENDRITPKDASNYYTLYGDSIFASEFILDRNSVNFFNVITKPHSTNYRTRFKPIIELTIDNQTYYVTSHWILFEAFSELCSNRLPFHGLPDKWYKIDEIKSYADSISNLVGEKFEKFVATHISDRFLFRSNIKSIGNAPVVDYPVYDGGKPTGRTVGQIDFIIINQEKKIIFIADAKHLKSKYITASFYNDKSKFDNYYIKLKDKVQWANENKSLVSKLFDLDLTSYEVQEFFITDAFVFYALFVDYPIIPLVAINNYIDSNDRLCYLNS